MLAVRGVADDPAAVRAPQQRQLERRARRENFPVPTRLVPGGRGGDLLRLYRFARWVDDLGDEAGPTPAQRSATLAALDAALAHLATPTGHRGDTSRREATPDAATAAAAAGVADGVVAGVVADVAPLLARGVPVALLRDLVAANLQDQHHTRYRSWEELLDYCRLSANPVGRAVLHLFGEATPERLAASDAVCTALQVLEHLQDVAEDAGRGRMYLPLAELAAAGARPEDLAAQVTSAPLRRAAARLTARARDLLDSSRWLPASLGTVSARWVVAGFLAGGYGVTAALTDADFDLLGPPIRPRTRDLLPTMVRLLRSGGLPPPGAVTR